MKKHIQLKSLLKESTVKSEFDEIMQGAGWATDEYILNFSELKSNKEKYELMLMLAKKGLLFDEDTIDDMADSIPKKGKMSAQQVMSTYRNFSRNDAPFIT